MRVNEIIDRIAEGEGLNTEFKRGLRNLSAIGKAICAFANTSGGVIILGVDDSQVVVGVNDHPEKVQERLTSFLETACNVPVSARLGLSETGHGWIHWIEIPRQRGFEPMRYGGRVYVRRSRSSVEPSPTELQELYNAFGYILTEERVIGAASSSDIDFHQFQNYLSKLGLETASGPQPTHEDDLRNRGVIIEFDGDLQPTLYGVMAFGKYPQNYHQTRNFIIQCCAYKGDERSSEVLQVAEIGGRLDEQVQRAVGWFLGLGRFENYKDIVRENRVLLPTVVLREALVNAVAHRDYAITGSKVLLEVFATRVDVTSPGNLPNHMSVDSVRAGAHPRSRNELMAYYMLTMGFMEQRGRGWPVMRDEMREFNGTEPELVQNVNDGFVRVQFRLGYDLN